jgi:hypothetical protein
MGLIFVKKIRTRLGHAWALLRGIGTWDAEVEVAVAPPARKTFFCTFGAMSRLKKVGFMLSFALNMNS